MTCLFLQTSWLWRKQAIFWWIQGEQGQLQIKIRWSSYYLILDVLKPRQKNIQWPCIDRRKHFSSQTNQEDLQRRKTEDEPNLKKISRLLWEKQHCADVYKREFNWISYIQDKDKLIKCQL